MLGKILEKNQVMLTEYVGEGEDNGKKFQILTTINCAPVIRYKGETFCYSWEELIKYAINIIDEKLDGKENSK
jgi:hypothetical protein